MKRRKKLITALQVAAGIYVAAGIALYFLQDFFLFHPKALPPDHQFSFPVPFIEHNITFQQRNLSVIQFPVTEQKGTIIFFHGNADNVERYQQYASFFTALGYELWMIDYPGYGKTTGKRSEEVLYKDALHVYQMATAQTSADSLIIYGKSIGTGIAAQLASVMPCKKLILETPYYSLSSLAASYFPIYPASLLIRYLLPTVDYLKKVTAPVILLHGTSDEIIPYAQSKKIKEEYGACTLITIQNAHHNNLMSFPAFKNAIRSLLLQ